MIETACQDTATDWLVDFGDGLSGRFIPQAKERFCGAAPEIARPTYWIDFEWPAVVPVVVIRSWCAAISASTFIYGKKKSKADSKCNDLMRAPAGLMRKRSLAIDTQIRFVVPRQRESFSATFTISWCLESAEASHSQLLGFRQIGPDVLVVTRAQFASRDHAIRGAFDGKATFDSNGASTSEPLVDESLAHAEQASEGRLGHFSIREVRCDIHGSNIAMLYGKCKSQAICETK